MPTGSSTGAITVRDRMSQPTRNAAPKSADAGSTTRWSAPTISADHVRHDDPDEPDRAADRDRGPGRQRGAEEGDALRAATSRPCVSALSTPRLRRLSGRASQANSANETTSERQRRDERLIRADVEVAHQPAQRAIGVGEIGEVLHEQDQRREERVHRHAGEQQRVGRQAAVPRPRQRVDDRDRAERAGEAGRPVRRAAPRRRASSRT